MNVKQGGCRGGRFLGGLTEMLQQVSCRWFEVTDASGADLTCAKDTSYVLFLTAPFGRSATARMTCKPLHEGVDTHQAE